MTIVIMLFKRLKMGSRPKIAIVILVAWACRPASAQTNLPDLIKRIRPSVVTVISYDSRGKQLKQGTGFLIDSNLEFVTNHHVFEGATTAEIKTTDGWTY